MNTGAGLWVLPQFSLIFNGIVILTDGVTFTVEPFLTKLYTILYGQNIVDT